MGRASHFLAASFFAAALVLACGRKQVVLVRPGDDGAWGSVGSWAVSKGTQDSAQPGRLPTRSAAVDPGVPPIPVGDRVDAALAGASTRTQAGAWSPAAPGSFDRAARAMGRSSPASSRTASGHEGADAAFQEGTQRLAGSPISQEERSVAPGSGFSPAQPSGPAPMEQSDASKARPTAPTVHPIAEPGSGAPEDLQPDLKELAIDFAGFMMKMSMLTGGIRVQISQAADFGHSLIDKRYDFADEFSPETELRGAGLPAGVYWARMAFIDLLGYQYPYSKPKQYRYRQ